MANKSKDFSGASQSMLERKTFFEEIFKNYPEFSFWRLERNNGKDIEIDYRDEVVCVVQDVNLVDCYCSIGTRKIADSDLKNVLEVRGGYGKDPNPETLFDQYRYRKGWSHPFTILVKDKESMMIEINKILSFRFGILLDTDRLIR